MIRAHIFSNLQPFLFFKQIPNHRSSIDSVKFSIGLDVPDDIDVLIVYSRASYSIPSHLPRERTVFVAGEPDVIHKYSKVFLNQFGQVLTSSEVELDTIKIHENYCSMWFVGVDFSNLDDTTNLKGIDYLRNLEVPEKIDKISVVTSNKAFTRFHQQRLAFLEAIRDRIPDRVDFFGRGFKSIDDKREALIPYKYHIALENGGGRFTWTEKLSDPLLCWALPFYHGCENAHEELPGEAFEYLDITDPDTAVRQMVEGIENGLWEKRLKMIGEAREKIMDYYNIMKMFARLADAAMDLPVKDNKGRLNLIRSERSLPTGPGERGSTAERILRSTLLKIDPKIELRASKLQRKIEARRAARRRKRIEQIERDRADGSA